MKHGPNWPRSDRVAAPAGASRGWPGWICKNSCHLRQVWPSDTQLTKCPSCMAPLIRYVRYEERHLS